MQLNRAILGRMLSKVGVGVVCAARRAVSARMQQIRTRRCICASVGALLREQDQPPFVPAFPPLQMGFEVQEACDGQQAVELFQTCLPACVLLDLQMPIMDGWETAEQLRLWEDQQQLARTPIVGCTALPLQEQWGDSATVEASALSSGFDEMLVSVPGAALSPAACSHADLLYTVAPYPTLGLVLWAVHAAPYPTYLSTRKPALYTCFTGWPYAD